MPGAFAFRSGYARELIDSTQAVGRNATCSTRHSHPPDDGTPPRMRRGERAAHEMGP
jgi:hypothetical protein